MDKKISLDQAHQIYYFCIPAAGHQSLFPSVFAIDYFIDTLLADTNSTTYGYCLFEDEIHLLLECEDKPSLWLDPFLMNVNQWHQMVTGDSGYLFNDTTVSRVLIQPKFAHKALHYLHQLPVIRKKAALPQGYLYSSYPAYLSDEPSALNTDFIHSLISHHRGLRKRRFEDFMQAPLSEKERRQMSTGNHSFYYAYAEESYVTRALSQYTHEQTETQYQNVTGTWENCINLLARITEFEREVLLGTARNHLMPDAHYVLAWLFVTVAKGPVYHVAKQLQQDETTINLNIRSVSLHHPASFLRYVAQRWQQTYQIHRSVPTAATVPSTQETQLANPQP